MTELMQGRLACIRLVGRLLQRCADKSRATETMQLCSRRSGTWSARCRRIMAKMSWSRPFDDPIPLPRGRQLVTLQDAGTDIIKLPKAEHEAPEWQAAMEALMLVAELGGPTMFARIGIMRALNRHVERVFNTDRKDRHWGSANWRGIGKTSPVTVSPL